MGPIRSDQRRTDEMRRAQELGRENLPTYKRSLAPKNKPLNWQMMVGEVLAQLLIVLLDGGW